MDFNTSEYDYLNEATLQEWVSEFLSRNKSFISDCKKIIKSWLEIKEGRDNPWGWHNKEQRGKNSFPNRRAIPDLTRLKA